MFSLTALINKIKGSVNVDISITLETGVPFSAQMEISVETVAQITENEAPYVWSDFFNCALPIDSLEYSHTDTNGVAGYRVAGTNNLVWRDQITFVAVAG